MPRRMRCPIAPWPGAMALIVVAGLAGCAVGPNFHRPAAPQTDRYTAQALPEPEPVPPAGTPPQHFVPGSDPDVSWWQRFGSSDIDALVDQALRANPTLAAAEATLRQSLENVAVQRGAYFPAVQAQASATRNRDAVQVLSPTLTSGASTYSLFTPQLTVSFVPDVFGGNRRQVESLQALAEVSRDQFDAAYLTLIANVVSAAIQEAGLRAQIEAAGQVIALERESLEVMRKQLQLGAIAESDVLAQDAALAQIEATLPPLQKALDQQHDLLAQLTGRLPAEMPQLDLKLDQIKLPEEIPIGVPSSLVERRPDVRAAEAQLHAATAAVGVAIANMLPQITLSAAIGNVASQTGQIFSGLNEFWTVGTALSQTLFAGTMLYHRERAARAGVDIAGAQYRLAVLTAFQNVADALRALVADTDAVRTQERAFDASTRSLEIARGQLSLGAVSYLSLLNAQQSLQQAIMGRAQALMNRYADTIALYQALGGTAPPELLKSH